MGVGRKKKVLRAAEPEILGDPNSVTAFPKSYHGTWEGIGAFYFVRLAAWLSRTKAVLTTSSRLPLD